MLSFSKLLHFDSVFNSVPPVSDFKDAVQSAKDTAGAVAVGAKDVTIGLAGTIKDGATLCRKNIPTAKKLENAFRPKRKGKFFLKPLHLREPTEETSSLPEIVAKPSYYRVPFVAVWGVLLYLFSFLSWFVPTAKKRAYMRKQARKGYKYAIKFCTQPTPREAMIELLAEIEEEQRKSPKKGKKKEK